MAESRIAEFLRARRAMVRPEDVGLPDSGRRRVPGLRREELAILAGVSIDYYTRLEQGRDHHPSEQIVDALARALRLDDDATAYLHRLARPSAVAGDGERYQLTERVRPGVIELLDAWDHTPAFVTGRYLDVLAANRLAKALSPMHAVGGNLLRAIFLDPRAGELHPDREAFGPRLVATLRAAVAPRLDDPALKALVRELSLESDEFRRLWAQHVVRDRADGVKQFPHPRLGPIELRYETFTINGHGAEGQIVVAYHAAPGSPGHHALTMLEDAGAGPRDTPATPAAARTGP
ncbi:MAG: helix-turn-helix domain-containing protein [Solirubrobacterales bacterium]|nr:helix-turn-helix domain-containing protein [Solirubrobacterales bacterium]